MAYNDGYYYGQCKLVAVVDNTADNGKTVLITTDDNKTYSGTIANKKCEFLLPPRTLYTIQKVSSGSAEFTTKVEAGYGDCILVHLDTGYVEVKQGDIVGLDYIKAATDANLKNKVPEAKAVKELNNSFGGMKFGIDSDGNYGYIKAGADSVTPFSNYWCGIGTCNIPIELPFKPKYIMAMAETVNYPRFSALRWDSESGDYYVGYYTNPPAKNARGYTVNVSDKTVNIAMSNTNTYYMFAIG